MSRRRARLTGWASALAAGLVSVPAMAQTQMPPQGPVMSSPVAQPGGPGMAPVPPTGPVMVEPVRPGGPIRRAIRHVCFTLQDRWIGYPEQFVEPPLGFYFYETLGMMKARADTHDFVLYRSDFIDGADTLSPYGAQKLSLMAARLSGWLGPITVEWTPDQPALADSRKAALVALLQKAGLPVVPERVVIGPSPYPGLLGADASNNYANLILRDTRAAQDYSTTPSSTANFGGGNR